jgi:hypothetical protein
MMHVASAMSLEDVIACMYGQVNVTYGSCVLRWGEISAYGSGLAFSTMLFQSLCFSNLSCQCRFSHFPSS